MAYKVNLYVCLREHFCIEFYSSDFFLGFSAWQVGTVGLTKTKEKGWSIQRQEDRWIPFDLCMQEIKHASTCGEPSMDLILIRPSRREVDETFRCDLECELSVKDSADRRARRGRGGEADASATAHARAPHGRRVDRTSEGAPIHCRVRDFKKILFPDK